MNDRKICIRCPVTGASVATGFRAAVGTDISHLHGVRTRHCAACGGEHLWNGENAYWEEQPPPARSLWDRLVHVSRRQR
jgi:hypothetical protein